MKKSRVARLIHEAMISVASKDNPISVWPKVGASGGLMWIVKDALKTAVIDTETGIINGNQVVESSEAFDAVVNALQEWYNVDRESYGGENIVKVKKELKDLIGF
jgi:hypothetical protein